MTKNASVKIPIKKFYQEGNEISRNGIKPFLLIRSMLIIMIRFPIVSFGFTQKMKRMNGR